MKISTKHGEVKYWVNKIGSKSQEVQDEVLKSLCEQKILRKEKNKFLWFISYDSFPAEDMAPENEVRHQIKSVVMDDHEPTPKDLMFLTLIESCDLIREIFDDREDYKKACDRIKLLTSNETLEKVVDGPIRQVMQAVNSSVATILAATSL